MKKDNRGLSLIELIVTIGMLAVLVGVGVIGFGMLSPREARRTRDNIKVVLENARMDALQKKDLKLVIWADDLGVHYRETVNVRDVSDPVHPIEVEKVVREEIIGKANVHVTLEKGGASVDLGNSVDTGAVFKFKRSTGGFDNPSPTEPFDITKIIVTKGSSSPYTLLLQKYTGKVIAE